MYTNQKKKKRKSNKPQSKPRTRAVREYTAGGMVFRHSQSGKDIDILMIQDRLGRWTIPKGHVEAGENLQQTALREVSEETGLKELAIRDKLDKIHFFYRREGRLIFMTTHVFLIEALGDTNALVLENSEGIVDVKWFSREKALELIEYKDTEHLFRLGLAKLQKV
ncbi:MAG TPA: NUDIX domain-containing protein [Candidatus Dormibacteraeota bacterium]|nr:NUDIX domain-containing protein [Candidatus Dormibacteraeota bacterium]